MDDAFKYTKAYGSMLESDYPYVSRTDPCAYKASEAISVNKGGFQDVQVNCPSAFVTALSERILSIGVEALGWTMYEKGVFENH